MAALTPLQDRSKQIRLLKSRLTEPGGRLSFDVSVWDLDKAPPYNAISYTWGEADEPSQIPALLQEEAEQVELVERLGKYVDPEGITQEHHDGLCAWLDDIEPRRNFAHMELYAMFGRPLRRDSIAAGASSDEVDKASQGRLVDEFDFSKVQHQLSRQRSELEVVRSTVREMQAWARTSVLIDGAERSVRRNCSYVLAQTRHHFHDSYIWIDSLCIDQANAAEKSCQVAIMFKIYKRARRVLAGIGHASDLSDRLFAVMQTFHTMKQAFRRDSPEEVNAVQRWLNHRRWRPPDDLRIWGKIFSSLDHMEIAVIAASFRALSQREYWTRLWVVQEIYAGVNVYCMCDSSIGPRAMIDWTWMLLRAESKLFFNPYCVLAVLIHGRKPIFPVYWGSDLAINRDLTMGKILGVKPSHKLGIDDLLQQYQGLHCTDRRDLVYGLLSLVDWNAMGVEPIWPDYNKSRLDVALEVRARLPYDPEIIDSIMTTLDLDSESPAWQDLVEQQHESGLSLSAPSCSPLYDRAYTHPLHTHSDRTTLVECATIVAGRDSTVELSYDHHNASIDPQNVLDVEKLSNRCSYAFRALRSHGLTIGLLCPAACEGDILVPSWYDSHVAMVLRSSKAAPGKFDLLGQAIVAMSLGLEHREQVPCIRLECSCIDLRDCKRFAAEVEVGFSVGDVFALEVQDFEDSRRWRMPWYEEMQFKRLELCPVANRVGSVSLLYVRCLQKDQEWRIEPAQFGKLALPHALMEQPGLESHLAPQ